MGKRFFDDFQIVFHTSLIHIRVVAVFDELLAELMKKIVPVFDFIMFEGKFGFPCQIEDDPIIKMVTYEDNSVPFAEERRLFYVALTRTKNRVYIVTPKNKPSRFLVELIKDFGVPLPEEINMDVVDLFQLRCPVCNYPLKYEFNKNYGLPLYICTNEPEVCDFMTNDRAHMHDIKKCNKCKDGYLIVKMNPKNQNVFYGCTNYYTEQHCKNMIPIGKA